jgi:hypothetical protein
VFDSPETNGSTNTNNKQMAEEENKLRHLNKQMSTAFSKMFVVILVQTTTTAVGESFRRHRCCLNSKHKRPATTERA